MAIFARKFLDRRKLFWAFVLTVACLAGAERAFADTPPRPAERIVQRARLEVERKVTYDPQWIRLDYPNGDPGPERGVCTDVVIRSYRAVGIDFQKLVHQDILARPSAYTTVTKPDASIDHRRVPAMLTYLRAHGVVLTTSLETPSAWRPGDIVVWSFKRCPACSPGHVGIVSDTQGPRGLPLVLHNIGPVPTEDDVLDAWTLLGHFRMLL